MNNNNNNNSKNNNNFFFYIIDLDGRVYLGSALKSAQQRIVCQDSLKRQNRDRPISKLSAWCFLP